MSRNIRSLNEDKEMMQSSLNRSRMKNAKLFDEISELNKDIHKYKRRLERAYRPIDITHDKKSQPKVYDSYSVPRSSEIHYRAPVSSEIQYRAPVSSEIHYRAPVHGFYDEDFEVRRRVPATPDPVVQKTYRTQDGVLHRIYTVQSAL